MSLEAMLWAFVQSVNPAQKVVLLAIANACNKTGYGFPGLDDILSCCQPMQRRMVQRHIRVLEAQRLLRRQERFLSYGKQTSNGYQLAMPGIDTTGWGEGVQSDTPTTENDTLRVSQLVHPEGVIAMTPTNRNLNQIDERSEEPIVRQAPDDVPTDLWITAEGILEFLNRKTGKHFLARHPNKDPTKSLRMVYALLKRGYTEQQVKQVVGNRLVRWEADAKMKEFLRPKTIFGPENFEQYLGQLGAA